EGLAGMLEVAQGVDHWDGSVLCKLGDGVVRKGAENDGIDPPLEIVRHIAQRFTRAEALARLVYEDRGAAERSHAGLEGDARAQRGLLEEEHELLARECAGEILRA